MTIAQTCLVVVLHDQVEKMLQRKCKHMWKCTKTYTHTQKQSGINEFSLANQFNTSLSWYMLKPEQVISKQNVLVMLTDTYIHKGHLVREVVEILEEGLPY